MMTGIGVQHRSECVFTFNRNDRSQSAGTRITDETIAEYIRLQGAEPQDDDRFRVTE
jgi:hypothetical protein